MHSSELSLSWGDSSLPHYLACTVVVGIKCYDALTFDLHRRQASQQENKTEERCLIHSFQNKLVQLQPLSVL